MTTTITLPRATVEQVLEALEFLSLDFFMLDPISPGREEGNKAITALRAALAQQAEQVWVCPEAPEERSYPQPGHCENCGRTLVLAHGIKE